MNIWLTTDTHFNHQNMIEYCGRPKGYEKKIEKGLHQIPPEDLLIHLGDVAWHDQETAHNRYIVPLRGKKWLIKGNHDKQSNQWYINHGWDFVAQQIIDRYFGKIVVLSHLPIEDRGYDLNIHGHFHNAEKDKYEPYLLAIKNNKQKLLALEYTNYLPVTLKSLIN